MGKFKHYVGSTRRKIIFYQYLLQAVRVPKDIQSRTEYFVKETSFNGPKTKESKRHTFVPSWKKIRNLSVWSQARYSKIDQESITHLKDK